jgi:hypothetical protein
MARLQSLQTLVAVALSGAAVAAVSDEPNAAILDNWLATYNRGDPIEIKSFEQEYVGDSNIAYALDSREESGGFDLVKIESDEPLKLTALLRERNFPSMWRATLRRKSATAQTLESIGAMALPMSQSDAIAALDSLTTRLTASDKFSGVVEMRMHRKTLYAKAFGLADRSKEAAITLDTPFLFASQGTCL